MTNLHKRRPRDETLVDLLRALLKGRGEVAAVVMPDRRRRLFPTVVEHLQAGRQDEARDWVRGLCLEAPEAFLTKVVDKGRPVVVDDLRASLRGQPGVGAVLSEQTERLGVRAALCAPLVPGRPGGGALLMVTSRAGAYGPDDLGLAQAFARCAARVVSPQLDEEEGTGRILAGVHHDLGNPLQAIRINLDTMLATLPPVDRRQVGRRQLESARRAAERMGDLLRELGDYLRATRRTPGVCSAAAAVGEAVEVLGPLASAKSIQILASLYDGGASVAIDRGALFRVLSNLIGNSIKFTEPGGRIVVTAARVRNSVMFKVHDTGKGIAAEHVERLLDADWVAKSPIRDGSGLGLQIAKGIVEAHGGQLSVASRPGLGSVFAFTLPLGGPSVADDTEPIARVH